MLIGYVSDEQYVGLPDVLVEFHGSERPVQARSGASGALYADLPPGPYEAILACRGYGSKRVRFTAGEGKPYQFRLLSDRLLGYVSPRCVRSGEESEFRVHSVEEYRLELWRYGAEKEFVRRIGTFDEHGPRATMQITPDGDYTQTGVQWNTVGYGNPALRQFIEAPARSGLYYFHARSRSGEFFAFPWIVAPRAPESPLAVLAADLTWNAYNSFGGRSNYASPDRLPPRPIVNSRQDLKRYTDPHDQSYDMDGYAPLSLDRPDPFLHIDEPEQLIDPIESRQGCHLLPAEWRLLGWMEREGVPHDLYGETQFHFDRIPLERYRVLVLSTHPEYWSKRMYDRLKRWVFEEGGRLIYLGGNGLNCEAELLDEQHVIYHNTVWSHSRPQPRPDGSGEYESRFHVRHESEANLLGVAFSFPGIMTGAPYRVEDAAHWCFAGTGLQNGDVFGRNSLHCRVPGGASGHETDKITPSSPRNTRLLAKGLNPGDGGAHMVHFETPGGGQVFSVGSITWPACVLVDDHVSKITANVIDRFLE